MNFFFTILLQLTCLSTSWGFSAPSKTNNNFFSAIKNIFENKSSPLSQSNNVQRNELKSELVDICNDSSLSESDKRKQVEGIIAQLEGMSPIQETATSPSLQQKWNLVWTTEKEINFFIDWNISGQITQTLDNGILENNIPFQKGGSFGVKGKLSIPNNSENEVNNDSEPTRVGLRTEFEFESATLDLGKWGSFSFPPVGKGWFDTVYLDDSFRIDTNSRNDILICEASSE